jgi:hypothetical protein
MRIELLYWEGCPSHPEALELLEETLRRHGVAADVEVREVVTDADAAALRFPGSPTIRIDGRDVDPDGADAPPSLTCRIYRTPDGVSPLPTREQLEEAVLAAAATQSTREGTDGTSHPAVTAPRAR